MCYNEYNGGRLKFFNQKSRLTDNFLKMGGTENDRK